MHFIWKFSNKVHFLEKLNKKFHIQFRKLIIDVLLGYCCFIRTPSNFFFMYMYITLKNIALKMAK